MELKILNNEERRTCHNHYRKNDMFRHWHPILTEIENITKMDAISVWYNAEMVLMNLRACIEYRDEGLNFIHSEIERGQKVELISAIMAVVLTRMMNATEEGHEEEDIPNDVVCNAILKKHYGDMFFERIMNVFFKRNIGNDGKKVVITPSDPMTQNISLDDMEDVAKEEILAYVDKVLDLTQSLKIYLKDKWEGWKTLWRSICMDAELLNLLKETNPNRNEWGFNQKMICNVVGICANHRIIEASTNALNSALTTKQVSSYIRNPKDFGGSDSAFTKEQYEKVEQMIRESL